MAFSFMDQEELKRRFMELEGPVGELPPLPEVETPPEGSFQEAPKRKRYRRRKSMAPVTTLEGQTQWYTQVLSSPDASLKEKREAMKEIADLHGLKKIKDFSNLQTKSTEELERLLAEVLQIWKTVGVLKVVSAGGDNSYLRN